MTDVKVSQRAQEAAAELAQVVLEHIATGTGPCVADCFTEILARFEASLPPSAPVDRDAVEGNIRIAIWNACMKGGMGQDLSLALIERAMSEAMMSRALPPSVLAESTSNDCLLVAEAVRDACAKACEDQAREFLSPQYATPQPIGSVQERFACAECGYAIRSLDLSGVGVG